MKKRMLTALLLVVAMLTCLFAGCSKSDNTSDNANASENTTVASVAKTTGGNTLVVYFSRVGNTDFPADIDASSSASVVRDDGVVKGNAQVIAEEIADELDTTVFEIQVEKKYPVDYNETIELVQEEQDAGELPKLATKLDGLDNYDTIHLVFPIWWGDLPTPLYTFFDEYDFDGKEIIVSVTHGGSSFSNTVEIIQKLEPNATVTRGISIAGSDVENADDQVEAWLDN